MGKFAKILKCFVYLFICLFPFLLDVVLSDLVHGHEAVEHLYVPISVFRTDNRCVVAWYVVLYLQIM